MYFDPVVKERREDFFNYERELRTLQERLREGAPMIVVKGRRRVGKTSLMRVAYAELEGPKAWVDARALAYGIPGKELLGEALRELLQQASIVERVKAPIKEISLPSITLSLEKGGLSQLIGALASAKGRLYLFIDEAQLLLREKLHYLLAQLYDSIPSLTIVLSGSEVGLLDGMLKNPESPLYGRIHEEIALLPLEREKAISFLLLGGQQAGIVITPEEAARVEERLDGIIGWLTWYGYYRVHGLGEREALERVVERAKEILRLEWLAFLEKKRNRELYNAILRAIATGMERWEDIKAYVQGKIGEVGDSSLSHALKTLQDYAFVVKEGRLYRLADPLLRELV